MYIPFSELLTKKSRRYTLENELFFQLDSKLASMFLQLETLIGEEKMSILFPREYHLKGAYLIKQGEHVENFYFLEKDGVARLLLEHEQVNLTAGFTLPFEFVGCVYRTHFDQTYSYSVQLLKDCYVRVFSLKKVHVLAEEYPIVSQILGIVRSCALQRSFDESNELRFLDAKCRYYWLMKSQPSLVKLVPSKYIAEYIGVSPECLSRIRASAKSLPPFKFKSSTELILFQNSPIVTGKQIGRAHV